MLRRQLLTLPLLIPQAARADGLGFLALHVDLWAEFAHKESAILCGLQVCHRSLSVITREMDGNCVDWAELMTDRCVAAGIDVQGIWCRANGASHVVVYHPPSGLVSDNQLRFPRTMTARHDLTDHMVVWPKENP